MKIDDLGEFGFIKRIQEGCIHREDGVAVGIGDDCAVFRASTGMAILLTTDMLIEDVHFYRDLIPPYLLGRKSLAVSLSDIAAMGGTPKEALVSIGIPQGTDVEFLNEIYDGLKAIAAEHEVNLLGGDTVISPDNLVINMALAGEAHEDEILLRSGACPGDVIFITGVTGLSAAGFDLLGNYREFESGGRLVSAHHDPVPHILAGRIIASSGAADSLIDISDGLIGDLGHICRESAVGAVIRTAELPVASELRDYCRRYGLEIDDFIFYGGEDYVLLGTAPEESVRILEQSLRGQDCEFYTIGEIIDGDGIRLEYPDGKVMEPDIEGHDHFRRSYPN
jgi:thiamine-monophosphate kinase